jgi:hypothetical protein
MFKTTLLLIFIFITKVVYSFTTLSGSVEHLTLSADKNPYIIEDNLTIKENGLLTIGKGLFFYLNHLLELWSMGSVVEGTLEKGCFLRQLMIVNLTRSPVFLLTRSTGMESL